MRHGLLHKMVGQTVQKGTGAGGAGGCFEGGRGGSVRRRGMVATIHLVSQKILQRRFEFRSMGLGDGVGVMICPVLPGQVGCNFTEVAA
jgi:hypothetical protein